MEKKAGLSVKYSHLSSLFGQVNEPNAGVFLSMPSGFILAVEGGYTQHYLNPSLGCKWISRMTTVNSSCTSCLLGCSVSRYAEFITIPSVQIGFVSRTKYEHKLPSSDEGNSIIKSRDC